MAISCERDVLPVPGVSGLPVLLLGPRLRALVVGGGSVAARKTAALVRAGATVRLVAPHVSAPLHDLARSARGRLTLLEREYRAGDIGDAHLVVAATSSRAVNASVVGEADEAGRLACAVDAPSEGTWTAMAAHGTGLVIVGVSAGGVPAAAARIRDAIAARFDGRYGAALARLAALRGALLERGARAEWRRVSGDLIGPQFCTDVESGVLERRIADAAESIRSREGAWRS